METPTSEAQIASVFAKNMKSLGFNCDFSLRSLLHDVDKILNSVERSPEVCEKSDIHYLAGIEAYIGETLRRLYNGTWQGKFIIDTPESNFYSSYLQFGDYKFYPARFLTYRLTHGAYQEGTYATYLQRILPKLATQ